MRITSQIWGQNGSKLALHTNTHTYKLFKHSAQEHQNTLGMGKRMPNGPATTDSELFFEAPDAFRMAKMKVK